MTTDDTLHQRRQRSLGRIRKLASWLDDALRIPGTNIRLGLDSIIGVIPGFGDTVGLLLSGVVIAEAVRLQAPAGILIRMLVIAAVDYCVGLIPIAGDIFDVYWKANTRNLGLLEAWLASETGEPH